MRGIWRLSYSQTAMTSYPALAPRSGRERIKASVAFTGGETSKDYFAWWDNLMTTGVNVHLNCVCDRVASKIGSKRECICYSSRWVFFSSVLSSTAALMPKLLLREEAEVRGHSHLWFTCKAGHWLHHANISWSTHFWTSVRCLLSCWKLLV